MGDFAIVERGVRIEHGVVIGDGVRIGEGAVIGPHVVLGQGVTVGAHARLARMEVGSGTAIEAEVVCLGFGRGAIRVGRQSYIGVRAVLDWSADIILGDHVHVAGPSTAMWTHSSVQQALAGDDLTDKTRRVTAPVVIEDRVYVGGQCTLYPGVTLGTGSVVMPNSAVDRDVPAGARVGGVPAHPVASRLGRLGQTDA